MYVGRNNDDNNAKAWTNNFETRLVKILDLMFLMIFRPLFLLNVWEPFICLWTNLKSFASRQLAISPSPMINIAHRAPLNLQFQRMNAEENTFMEGFVKLSRIQLIFQLENDFFFIGNNHKPNNVFQFCETTDWINSTSESILILVYFWKLQWWNEKHVCKTKVVELKVEVHRVESLQCNIFKFIFM